MSPLLVGKQIDLVDFGDVKLLMFRDDNLYNLSVSKERKGVSLREHSLRNIEQGYAPSSVTKDNACQVAESKYGLLLVMVHLWGQGIDFDVLDVGAHIGDFSIKAGNLIRTFGKSAKVYAFDPTAAGALIPSNAEINGLQDIVHHQNLAVDDVSGFVLFTIAEGMSDASNIGDKGKHRFNVLRLIKHFLQTSYKGAYLDKVKRCLQAPKESHLLARSVTILDWLKDQKNEKPLFVKLDIEGTDKAVLKDLVSLGQNRHILCVFEFCPDSFRSFADAAAMLESLMVDYCLFDIWYSPTPAFFQGVKEGQCEQFVRLIALDRIFGYTDVLMIPKALPGLSELRQRLESLAEGRREYIL